MFGNLESSEILEIFYNFIETTKENLESVFYLTPMFEKNIYEKLYPFLKDLSNSFPVHFKKAAMWILSTQERLKLERLLLGTSRGEIIGVYKKPYCWTILTQGDSQYIIKSFEIKNYTTKIHQGVSYPKTSLQYRLLFS